jgi:hypothetical protein
VTGPAGHDEFCDCAACLVYRLDRRTGGDRRAEPREHKPERRCHKMALDELIASLVIA